MATSAVVVDVFSGDNDEMGTPVVDNKDTNIGGSNGVDLNEIFDHHGDDDDVILADTTTTSAGQEEVAFKKKRAAFSAAYDLVEKKVCDFLAGNISPSEVASCFNCVVAFVRMLEAVLPYVFTLFTKILSFCIPKQQPLDDSTVPTYRLASPPNQLKILFHLKGVTNGDHVSFYFHENKQIFIKSMTSDFKPVETFTDLPPGDYSSAKTVPSFDPKTGILLLTITGFLR